RQTDVHAPDTHLSSPIPLRDARPIFRPVIISRNDEVPRRGPRCGLTVRPLSRDSHRDGVLTRCRRSETPTALSRLTCIQARAGAWQTLTTEPHSPFIPGCGALHGD